jgi:hypothetical protein
MTDLEDDENDTEDADEWQRLRRHIELVDGSWVGYVVGDRPTRDFFHDRVQEFARARGQGLVVVQPRAPAELSPALAAILDRNDSALLWLDPRADPEQGAPAPGGAETDRAWAAAWVGFANQLNEHRETLRRSGHTILLAIDPIAKQLIREHAPDLWSTRAIVVEESGPEQSPPSRRPPIDIFLSHAAADARMAKRLASALTRRGLTLTVDPWDLSPGADWASALEERLARSEGTLILLSDALLARPWSHQELTLLARRARTSAQRLFPVLHDLRDLRAIPAELLDRQWIDLRGQEGPDLEHLLDRLAEALRPMPPRVFITYSHDSNVHLARVRDLADRLRQDGLDVRLDQYEPHPAEGWLKWMTRQIDEADFVLVVCTDTYRRRFDGHEAPKTGLGATLEGHLIQQVLYDAGTKNHRFIPVLFDALTTDPIPLVLRAYTRYLLDAGYDDLYRHLTRQPRTPPPPIGAIRPMPPEPRPAPAATPTTSPPASSRITILLATANAADPDARLCLDEEARAIEEALQRARLRDRYDLRSIHAATFDDLLHRLDDLTPSILHFAGHGDRGGVLIFKGPGGAHRIPPDSLRRLFAQLQRPPALVVIAACHSDDLARHIAPHVGHAIGFAGPLGDLAARHFSAVFYERLAAHASPDVPRAFALAQLAAVTAGFAEVDAACLFDQRSSLAQPARTASPAPQPSTSLTAAATPPPTASSSTPPASAATTSSTARPAPTEPAYRWLHLSDLHLSADASPLFWSVRDAFEQSLTAWLPKLGGPIDLLLLTGDLAAHGAPADYDRLDDLLARLQGLLERHTGVRPLIVPVPGNHDLQRPSEDDLLRYLVIDRITSSPQDKAVKHFNNRVWRDKTPYIIEGLFTHYTAWLARAVLPQLRAAPHVALHTSFFPGDLTVTLDAPGRFPLALVGLNTAWSHYESGDFAGRLHLPVEQFLAALPPPAKGASPLDLFQKFTRALLLQHHPRRWLTEPARRAFESELYPPHRFTAALFGHMHEPDAVNEARAGGRSRTYYQAPSFFGLERYGEGASESRLFGYTFGQLSQGGALRVWPLRAQRKGDGAWAFDRDTYFHWSDNDLDGVLLRPADPPPEPARTRAAAHLHPADLDLTPYCTRLRDRTRHIRLDGIAAAAKALNYPIERLYTRLRTHTRDLSGDRAGAPDRALVDLADLLPRHRRVLIEGQPGSGKTTFLKLAASVLARDHLDEPCPDGPSWRAAHLGRDLPRSIPVLLRGSTLLHDPKDSRRGDARLLAHLAAETAPPLDTSAAEHARQAAWHQHLLAGAVTLLLDGLDEVGDPAQRDRLFDDLQAILQAWPKCQVILTSRPIEIDRIVALGFAHASVAPFDDDDVRAYAQRWVHALFEVDPDRHGGAVEADYARALVDAIHGRRELRRLATTPVMLTCLCVVYSNGGGLPEGRAELYRDTIRWLIAAREDVRRERSYVSELRDKDKDHARLRVVEALSVLALAMMGDTGEPPTPDAVPPAKRRELGLAQAAPIVEPIIRGPRFDHPDRPTRHTALCEWLRFECEYSGVIEELGRGQLQFKHLTFQEYLAAARLAACPRDTWWPIVAAHLEDLQWRETIDLFPGCLLDPSRGATADADYLVQQIHALFPDRPPLVRAATITALTGRLQPAFRATGYSLPPHLAAADDQLRRQAEAIFTVDGAAKVDEATRIAAAEAIGLAGDRRLTPENFLRNFIEVPIPGTDRRFALGKYPVTVEEYARFVDDRGYHRPEFWTDDDGAGWTFREREGWHEPGIWEQQLRTPNRPVVAVSFYEAAAYCRWLASEHPGSAFRLPTEREWLAAASPDGRKKTLTPLHANFGERVKLPAPVGIYPAGAGPYGHLDLAGNVWEWCVDILDLGRPITDEDRQKHGPPRALRGGAYWAGEGGVAAAVRYGDWSRNRNVIIGFRVVFEPASP